MGTFDLTVISDPTTALAPNAGIWDVDLSTITGYDADLLKPALLFADSVKLITTRVQLQDLAHGEILHANAQMIPQYYRILGMSMRGDWKAAANLGIKREWLPTEEDARLLYDKYKRPKRSPEEWENFQRDMEAFIQRHEKAFRQYQTAVVEISEERLSLLTSQDIVDAEESGLVKIEGWSDSEEERLHHVGIIGAQAYLDEVWQRAASKIESTTGAVMLEPGSSLVLQQNPSAADATGEIGADRIAVSALGMLPGLKSATIADVLTVREALSAHLPHFRSAAIELSQQVRDSDPADARDALKKIDEQWHREINPALSDIRFALEKGSFRRHILEEFSNKDSITATAGSAVMLFGGGTVIGGVAAMLSGSVGGAYPLIKAAVSTLKDRDKAKENRFFFLYGARERLAKYAPD